MVELTHHYDREDTRFTEGLLGRRMVFRTPESETDRLRQAFARQSRHCLDMAEELKLLHVELQDSQKRLARYERLACLGELTAGIAHEVNNLLAYMMFNLGSMDAELDATRERFVARPLSDHDIHFVEESLSLCRQMTGDSLDGMDRIQEIVRGLKEFANDRATEVVWTNLNQVVDISLRLMAGDLKHKIEVCKTLSDLPLVLAYPKQLSQVLINLFVNAAHAMDSGGRLEIQTFLCDDEARISVTDNGSGIPKEIQSRIFDPFFTTKPNGIGTGLGLGVAAEIMNRHFGRLDFESEEGKGTTFLLGLKVVNPDLQKIFDCQKKERDHV